MSSKNTGSGTVRSDRDSGARKGAILREIRVLLGSTHTLKYRIKCNYPGSYSVLPPTATLMYNTRINGAGASKTATIGK